MSTTEDLASAGAGEFLTRACPACGTSASGNPAVATEPRGETLSYAELKPRFIGFFKSKSIFSYYRCAGCGMLFAPTFFTDAQLAELYASMPPNMEEVPPAALEATQAGYYRFMSDNVRPSGDFLEIGPDIGLFTQHAARSGAFSKFWLFEPNTAVHAQLQRLIGNVPSHIDTALFDLDVVPNGCVGAAAMIHVLDHLNDPVAFLRTMRDKMRTDGVLLTVTHDEGSVLAKLLGARWPAYCLQHPHLFNQQSMRRLLREAGFDTLRTSGSTNVFPLTYLARHGAYAFGLGAWNLPAWPDLRMGLKLGNFLTLARPSA